MKVTLLLVGKTDAPHLTEAINDYQKRLQHYLPFETIIIPDVKNAKKLTQEQLKEKEGELILRQIQPTDHVVLLDEKGKEFTSLAFSSYIERKMHSVNKRLVFIVGGPYGFAEKVYAIAPERLSLSKMTFSHQMIRLFFVEQLYRAMTILHNEPYHHE